MRGKQDEVNDKGEDKMQFRRDWLRSTAGGALVALLPTSAQVRADDTAKPSDPFILLLKGLYHPVVNGPKAWPIHSEPA